METTHMGKLAVCSQPLHTNRAWLHNWAKHYLEIGADAIIMHVPRVRHPLPISGRAALLKLSAAGLLRSGCNCTDCRHIQCIKNEAWLIPESSP